jgi:peptidyl-tRNA hydrolase
MEQSMGCAVLMGHTLHLQCGEGVQFPRGLLKKRKVMERPVMYILANKGLGMSAGKLAAQVGHGVGRSLLHEVKRANDVTTEYLAKGETKIVLECRDTEHLLMAERYLNEHGIKTFLVIDEGRTEIPAHSPTVLATEIVDKEDPNVRFALGDFKTYKDGPERDVNLYRTSEAKPKRRKFW